MGAKAQASMPGDLEMIRQHVSRFKGQGPFEGLEGTDALNRTLRFQIVNRVLPTLAQLGNFEAVEGALECSADPNAEDTRHIRALTYAAAHSHSRVVDLLVQNHADESALENASEIVRMSSGNMDERVEAISVIAEFCEA